MQTLEEANILLVDDSHELLTILTDALHGAGFAHVACAQSVREAREAFARERPDIMVLDINLPDGDGFTLFGQLRAQADVPALFLSARDADGDRLFGLGLGADDYLTKPFLTQELLLRMRTILRRAYRTELSATAPVRLGGAVLRMDESAVARADGQTLPLTATERQLLAVLLQNRGRIVTYDTLCARVWGGGYYGYENSLNVHIRHLREKIEDNPSRPRFLLTVRGLGYKLAMEEQP